MPETALDPWRLPVPGIAGHRGGLSAGPENTLIGITHGLAAGATHVEVDVRSTRDDVAVCMHDPTATRTCGDPARIDALDLVEVRELDPCMGWEAHQGIASGEREPPPGLTAGWYRVPTVQEVLSTFRGVPVILDLKENTPVESVVEAASAWRRETDLLLAGHDDAVIQAASDALPGVPVAAGEQATRAFYEGDDPEVDALVVPFEHEGIQLAGSDEVARAHAQGTGFWVWTINDPEQAWELFEKGVDGVVTDVPRELTQQRLRLLT